MAPVSRTLGRPHMSVTTSMSRWIPSGSTGRCANREPDQALITASLAAQRAARWRAADELLSAASRRSPGVNVSANTVPGLVDLLGEVREWRPGRSPPRLSPRCQERLVADNQPRCTSPFSPSRDFRVQQHRRPPAASPAHRGRTGGRRAARRAERPPAIADASRRWPASTRRPDPRRRPPAARDPAPPGTPAGAPARSGPTRARTRGWSPDRPSAGTSRPAAAVSRSHTKCASVGQLVVDAVQAAVRRDDAVAQHLAQAHHLERRRAALGVTGQALLADDEQRRRPRERPSESASRSCSSVSLGSLASVEVSCLEITAMSSAPTPELGQRARQLATPCRRGRRPAHPARVPGSRCARRRRKTARRPPRASTGSPILSARSPRASRTVPPPWDSTKPEPPPVVGPARTSSR